MMQRLELNLDRETAEKIAQMANEKGAGTISDLVRREPEFFISKMHIPFDGNRDDLGGYEVTFSCDHSTVIPVELDPRAVFHKLRCPGCGAPSRTIQVVYRKTPD